MKSKFRGCRATESDIPDEMNWISCMGGCDLGFGSSECKEFRKQHKAIIEYKENALGE